MYTESCMIAEEQGVRFADLHAPSDAPERAVRAKSFTADRSI